MIVTFACVEKGHSRTLNPDMSRDDNYWAKQ